MRSRDICGGCYRIPRLTSVGSSHPAANARTAALAQTLAEGSRWAGVQVAFATGQTATLPEAIERLRARGARRMYGPYL